MKSLSTVDLFCGAGGASTGLELALKRLKMGHHGLAINHWPVAVDTMRENHPDIDTKQMSIEEAVPADLVPGGVVDLLWASPSCTHHSRAKGGKPRSNQLRAQPELIFTWLDQLFVRRLIIENVPEFIGWGPLTKDGKPIKRLVGQCFLNWVDGIRKRNYIVDWRIVNCADYGDATSRKRFFLKAVRRGCGKIHWPEPTHAENPQPDLWGHTLKKWRGVRECLDLNDLGTSIFNRDRPLSLNTLRRVAVGMAKYNGMDFLMDMLGSDGGDDSRVHPLTDPLPTQHSGGNRCAVVRPFLVRMNNNCDAQSVDDPIGAQTTHDRYSVVQPFIMDYFGLKHDHAHHVKGIDKPMRTITTFDNVQIATPVIFDEAVGLPRLPDGRYIDILLRMLKPSELAAAHSFPKDYVLTGNRSEQVKQIGNSVPVLTAAAMCEVDFSQGGVAA